MLARLVPLLIGVILAVSAFFFWFGQSRNIETLPIGNEQLKTNVENGELVGPGSNNPRPSTNHPQALSELPSSPGPNIKLLTPSTNSHSVLPTSQGSVQDIAKELALSALRGDTTALSQLAELTDAAVRDNHPNMTLAEQEKEAGLLRPIWQAFDLLAEKAGKGDADALRTLTQAARSPSLAGLAMKALGTLAAGGSEGALNVILDPANFGIEVPRASTTQALDSVARAGNPRAISALASLGMKDADEPLWYMAAEALRPSAAAGNREAIDALISFSRSTNFNILRSVRAGLAAASAKDAAAREALGRLGYGE